MDSSPRIEFSFLLEKIETWSGLRFCLKNFAGSGEKESLLALVPPRHRSHFSPFCMDVKQSGTERCKQCDLRDVPRLAAQCRKPFVHRCHAGASEVIIPILIRENLVALGFLGQFRISDSQPDTLPLFQNEQVETVIALGMMVQLFFLYEVEHTPPPRPGTPYRRGQILRFLQSRPRSDPALADLARELGVSPSRAGHIVRETCGESFVALKKRLRIEAARQMLAGTLLTVDQVAYECGFRDPRYFYRAFRDSTGMSPGKWRLENQDSISMEA